MKPKTTEPASPAAEPKAAPTVQPPQVIPAVPTATAEEEEAYALRNAPPGQLLEHLAEQEPSKLFLKEYFRTIRILRRKGYSFRDIAEWLTNNGVEVDYNAVYRVYQKYLPPGEEVEEELREQKEIMDEANEP